MPFPEAKRIIYRKNPLDEVICQLRFPPILSIDTDVPAPFQDRIRKDFPNFTENTELQFNIEQSDISPLPPEVLSNLVNKTKKNYEFLSFDGIWKVNLTRSFIALSTKKYIRWEEFRERLVKPYKALLDIYSPAYFSRIGLRYIDVIKRSSIGLSNTPWKELLQPYIIGVLSVDEIGSRTTSFNSKYEIELADLESTVRINTKFVKPKDSDEICFMIDSDFFINKSIDIEKAFEKLDFFNMRGSRLIQWCITGRLNDALEPELI